MTGSISELATFVAAQNFHYRPDAIAAEQVVLESYTFLPYVRSGVAAVLNKPFDWSLPSRSTAELSVPVEAANGRVAADVTVTVRGPGDVVGIDAGQVIRCYPRAGAADALVEELAHIEFDRPDFPWMFTPTGPTPDHQLVPWVCLVVVSSVPGEASPIAAGRAGGLRTLQTTRQELPQLGDAWAWAHAQVMGPTWRRAVDHESAVRGEPGDQPVAPAVPAPAGPADVLRRLRRAHLPGRGRSRSRTAGQHEHARTGVERRRRERHRDHAAGVLLLRLYHRRARRLPGVGGTSARRACAGGVGSRLSTPANPAAASPIANGPGREMIVEGPVVSLPRRRVIHSGRPADQVWPAAQRGTA